jgi:hypothetical protein
MSESRDIHSKSLQKDLRRKLQIFCITGSVALWSETEIQNHNATVLQLGLVTNTRLNIDGKILNDLVGYQTLISN